MANREHWVHKIASDFQGEGLPGIPLLELAGDRRILIECHSGVTAYGPEEIGVGVRYGKLLIKGSGLCLSHMSRDKLVISGRIDAVHLVRRNEHGDTGKT